MKRANRAMVDKTTWLYYVQALFVEYGVEMGKIQVRF